MSLETGVNFDYISFEAGGESIWLRVPAFVDYSLPVANNISAFAAAGLSLNIGLGGSGAPFRNDGRVDAHFGIAGGVRLLQTVELKIGYGWGLMKAYDTDASNHRNTFHVGVAYLL